MTATIRAAGVVLATDTPRGRRYLLLENARHGTWGFAKGHLDDGETPLAGASREVAEETGLHDWTLVEGFHEVSRYAMPNDRPAHPVHGDERGRIKEVHYFLGLVSAPVAELSGEHSALAWVGVEEASTMLHHDENRRILDLAEAHLSRMGDGRDADDPSSLA
ncbi:MAG: NUDIX domain-containing protein [Planctomycetes bacterium]|nr:NUDIX domain-containing protein [Planctomycetota bacterium]MCB9919255.1 NUDIX domain-containing protein [Planctomycetota bacterium]